MNGKGGGRNHQRGNKARVTRARGCEGKRTICVIVAWESSVEKRGERGAPDRHDTRVAVPFTQRRSRGALETVSERVSSIWENGFRNLGRGGSRTKISNHMNEH